MGNNRLKAMTLLTSAADKVNTCCYLNLPKALDNRAQTIERKIIDLIEELREWQPKD